MDSRTVRDAYRESTLETAPPIKVVRLLYEGALRFLDQAAAADPKDPHSRFVDGLTRADLIVTELRLSLEHQQAPQVAAGLEQLYLFTENRIQAALQQRDTAPIAEARDVLARLFDAWSQVAIDGSAG